jgi:hypothetical protein
MCGKQRTLSPLDLEVWQTQGLRADFADVWQGKELEGEKEVDEGKWVGDKEGKRNEEAVRKRAGVRRSRFILFRGKNEGNCTAVQK